MGRLVIVLALVLILALMIGSLWLPSAPFTKLGSVPALHRPNKSAAFW
jgi:hypothetical protein